MNLMEFLEIVMNMKNVEREGWIECGIQNPETSANHSFMVALMVLVLGKDRMLDLSKSVKMGLVHDLPEAIVGDMITKENWEKGGRMWESEKSSMERPAARKLSSLSRCPEILELWEEFEARKTPEAKFVKDIDRIATIFQAMEYHKKKAYKKPMQGFWDEKALSFINDPELRKFVESAMKKL